MDAATRRQARRQVPLPQAIVTPTIPALRTLGELRFNGAPSSALSSPRIGLTLLTYLARRSPRPVDRGALADLFWRERNSSRARQSLRQVLLELKRLVGDGLVLEQERVSVVRNALTLDVSEFEASVRAGRWREAVDGWHGEFLPRADNLGGDDFRLWLESERETLHQNLRVALRELLRESRSNGDWEAAAAWALRWVDLLPLDEEGHHQLIELLHIQGHNAEALSRYTAFQAHLRALEATPSPAFVQLGLALERAAAGARPQRTPGSAALFTPDLSGRGHALEELNALWRRVQSGSPATLLIEGEAGIGKSRLCEEFLRGIVAEHTGKRPTILRARGYETGMSSGVAALSELVAALAAAPGATGASAGALGELARIAPLIHQRFPGLPLPEHQHGLEEALVEVLSAAAAERPVVLYFDDLPLADAETQQVLMALTSRVDAPLLLLVTARTGEDRTAAYLELSSRSGLRRLKLQPLGLKDVELLVGSMLELTPSARHQLAGRLYSEGGGNPFYTIELTAALVDEGRLLPTEAGDWRLETTGANVPMPLPATIREVVRRRLERLKPEVRAVLEAAAVLGRVFDSQIIAPVSGLSSSTCAVGLEELLARRMVRGRQDSSSGYEFTHEFIARVGYDLIPARRRDALHRSAAAYWKGKAAGGEAARSALEYHRAKAGTGRISRWSRRVMLGLAAMALLVVAGFALMPTARRASLMTILTRSTPTLSPRRIVVAPLTNHTGDTALTGMSALAADWIAQALMRTTEFEVVDPRTASVASRIVEHIPSLFRDGNHAIAVATETGSGTVVSGDLFREGDTLRVLVRVIDAASGTIIRTVGPVSGLQTEPSNLVARLGEQAVVAVASALDTTSRGFSAALGVPPSYDAYIEVSRAWESFFRDELDDVFVRLERASSLDTSYMAPLLMRAYIKSRLSEWQAVDTALRRLNAHESTLTRAERAVLRGLRADFRGDLWGRLRAARELMELTPASVEGYTLAASTALMVNRPRESLQILSKVDPDRGLLLVAPYYWITHTSALHRLGDHKAELQSARSGVRRFPDRYGPHVNLLFALAAAGDVKAARQELMRTTRDDPFPGTGSRRASLWIWRELRTHGHARLAAAWLETLVGGTGAGDSSMTGLLLEGDIEAAAGRWTRAREHYSAALVHAPQSPLLLGRLGTAEAHLGNRSEAGRLDASLAAFSGPYLFGSHTYARARIAAALGDRARAVELLRTAWTEGRPIAFDDRENEDVHSDPEFATLVGFLPYETLMRGD
jgi:DNA-binding SARP family transcriptional activator/tetratricopeptide (TPR) repeat protein/TolB-like protein